MAGDEGNGKSYDRIEELEDTYETNMYRKLRELFVEAPIDERDKAVALDLFASESVEEMAKKIHTIRRGSWKDNLLLAGAAVGGLLAGHAVQGALDFRSKRGVPLTGMLGVVPIGAGLALDRSLTARNAVGLGGMLFLAGAGLFTRNHPAADEDVEE